MNIFPTEIEELIILVLKKNLDESSDLITRETRFSDLGMDSLKAIMIVSDIEKSLKLESLTTLDSTIFYMHPTVKELAQFLLKTGSTL